MSLPELASDVVWIRPRTPPLNKGGSVGYSDTRGSLPRRNLRGSRCKSRITTELLFSARRQPASKQAHGV